jgi:uncharacterized protein involved in cysteine biosynthesis
VKTQIVLPLLIKIKLLCGAFKIVLFQVRKGDHLFINKISVAF